MKDWRFGLRDALHLLDRQRDVIKDTHGNLSVRDGTTMYIKPSGVPYADISAGDICAIDMVTGQPLDRNINKPSVDWPHHLSLYRRNPDVGAICHSHSPYATGFAWADCSIACIGTEHADFFGHEIRCLPYADLDTWGDKIDRVYEEKAILLGRHGVVTFAKDPFEAVKLAVAVENVAVKYYIAETYARAHGRYNTTMHPEERNKWHKRYNGGGYGQ